MGPLGERSPGAIPQGDPAKSPSQAMVSVSFLCFVTLSFVLTMNQLFCARGRTIADRVGHAIRLARGRIEGVGTAGANPAHDLADASRVGIARRPLRQDGVERRDIRARVAVVAGRPADQDVVAVARDRIDAAPPIRMLNPVPVSVSVSFPTHRSARHSPSRSRSECCHYPTRRTGMALTVPLAVRFVTPVKALASTIYEGLPLLAVAVRLAVVMPLRPSVMPSVEVTEVLVRVKPALLLAVTIPVAVSLSNPVPVQPLTVNVLPALVAARLAMVMPIRPSAMPSVEESERVGQRIAGALARRHSVCDGRAVGQRSASGPAADREGVTAGGVGEVGSREPVQGQRGSRPVTASEVLVRTTLLDTTSTRVSRYP